MSSVGSAMRGFALFAISLFSLSVAADPTPGQNVNMVSGRQLPGGDPFLQRQNEPSIAISSRNPLHLLAGANDYRTVDLPMPDQLENDENTGDAWLGLFKSFNGGQTWQSTLVPGYPQDQTTDGKASPLKGFTTASDPVVRSGTNGLFYYAGIAFNRATNQGVVFVSRYIDLNNRENGNAAPGTVFDDTADPIRYGGTQIVSAAQPGEFLDKPWIAVDVPRPGASTCTLTVKQAGSSVTQGPFPAGNVYLAYTKFFHDSSGATIGSQLMFSRSTDCGATWSAPKAFIALDELTLGTSNLHQGIALKVDPEAGFVYAVWRRFKSTTRPDSILGAVSLDGGRNFTPGIPLVTLPAYDFANPGAGSFFDQGTSGATFRTNAFPAIAVDDSGFPGIPGRVYLAWSQRTAPYGDARIQLLNLPGSILVSSTGISLKQFTVSGIPLSDDTSDSFSRGHQLMPQLAFTQGKLLAAFYDLRIDHTYSTFTRLAAPDAQGRLFLETLNLAGELLVDPTKVFTPFVSDANPPLNLRRHTIDVVVAEANPGNSPVFTTARVSRYKSGVLVGDATGTIRQLQVDPPGLPLFRGGDVPFFGDYIDIAGQTFVPKGAGWAFNSSPASSPVHVVAWTSNQDVRPPLNGDWHDYTPVGLDSNRTSFYDPTHPGGAPDCRIGQEGMRNQNIYSSRITEGLVLASPQNTKPLSATVQRAFSLVVQNLTRFTKSFRLTIVNQPPNGGFASFVQAPNTTPLPRPLPAASKTLDVSVGPHAGIARSVFVISGTPETPTASVTVRADEITTPGSTGTIVVGGLSSFIVFNADGTVPPLVNPDSSPADIGTLEIYDPDVANPDVANPNEGKSAVPNPDVANPDVANPDVANPDVANPDVANPDVANVNVTNPDVANPDVANSTISDATYTVTNDGNTSASYNVKLVGNAPAGAKLQLILNKSYRTPVAVQCDLKEESQNTLQSNVLHPNVLDPASPDVANPAVGDATLSLQPGEHALITLRGNVTLTTMQQIVTTVTPVVVAQAANTGSTKPTVATAPLTIIGSLPGAAIGRNYAATLRATGGLPPYTWSLASPLPHGLGMTAGGVISGTVATDVPAAPQSFTAVVTDARHVSKSRLMTIAVVQPIVYFLRQDGNGNSVVGTIDTSGVVNDALGIGSGFDALTYSDVDLGYGPNLYYYLRHDAKGFSTFGTLDLSGVATDRFGVGFSFNALTFVGADLGYGPNLFYYLRQDGTGFSTFGTISTSGVVTDRFGVGTGFNALAFARNDLGYGPNLFYYVRTDATTTFSTFGTIAVSGDVNDRFGLGYFFNALAYTEIDLGYGANLFYSTRSTDTGVDMFGTISTSGAVVDRFGTLPGVNALTFGTGTPFIALKPACADISSWTVSSPLNNSSVSVQNHVVTITSDGSSGAFAGSPGLSAGAGIESNCRLSGDFDIQVDFSQFSAPPASAAGQMTQAFFHVYQDAQNQLHVKRISGINNQGVPVDGVETIFVNGGVQGGEPVAPPASASGTFRIIRKGNVITTSVGGHTFTQSGLFTGDVNVALLLLGPGTATSKVVYGNFAVNSGNWAGDVPGCYPNLPAPVIAFDHVDSAGRYYIPVQNFSAFPDALFTVTGQYGPCGLNTTPSRTWVDIYEDTNPPQRIYGFCDLRSAQDLTSIWTQFPPDTASVHIVLHDRACNLSYTSNSVTLPSPIP